MRALACSNERHPFVADRRCDANWPARETLPLQKFHRAVPAIAPLDPLPSLLLAEKSTTRRMSCGTRTPTPRGERWSGGGVGSGASTRGRKSWRLSGRTWSTINKHAAVSTDSSPLLHHTERHIGLPAVLTRLTADNKSCCGRAGVAVSLYTRGSAGAPISQLLHTAYRVRP